MSEYRICAMYRGPSNALGISTGQVCLLKTKIDQNLLWVTWHNNSCPYPNLEKFLENWEIMKYDREF